MQEKIQYITQIVDRLKTVRKEVQQNEVIANAVDLGLKQSFDCLSPLPVIDAAFTLMTSGSYTDKNVGLRLYLSIENYFSENPFWTKRLLPDTYREIRNIEEQEVELKRWLGTISDKIVRLQKDPWFQTRKYTDFESSQIHVFIRTVKQTLQVMKNSPPLSRAEFIIFPPYTADSIEVIGERSPAVQYTQEYLSNIFGNLDTSRDNGTSTNRESLLSQLFRRRTGILPQEYDLVGKKYGKYAIEDLLSIQDQHTFNQEVLNFIVQLPHGNYVWHRLAEEIFLKPVFVEKLGSEINSEYRDRLLKIFEFQLWFSTKSILPGFKELIPSTDFGETFPEYISDDISFDELFRQLLQYQYPPAALRLGVMMSQTVRYAPSVINELESQQDIDSIITVLPIAQLAMNNEVGTHIRHLELEIERFLRRHEHLIESSLLSRFKRKKIVNYWRLQEGWRIGLGRDDDPQMLLEDFKEGTGRFLFLEKWALDDLLHLKETMWKEATQHERVYWPHPDVDHPIEFPVDNPLAEWLDIEKIVFITEDTFSKPVTFHIYFPGHTSGLVGKLDEMGNIEWVNFVVTEDRPSIFHFIVWASFGDLLKGAQIIHRQAEEKRTKKERTTQPQAQEMVGGESQPLELPRRKIIYIGQKSLDTDIRTLVGVVEKEKGTSSPVFIGTHKSRLRGRDVYSAAYAVWKKSGERRDGEEWENLIQARKQLHQPRGEKIINQPSLIRLQQLVDPDTGESLNDVTRDEVRPLYAENWIAPFRRPQLDEGEKLSLERRYEKRYTAGSALLFIANELTRLAAGIED